MTKVLVSGTGMVPFRKPGAAEAYDAMAVAAVRLALAEEIRGNRRRLAKSREGFADLARLFEAQYAYYEALWQRLGKPDAGDPAPVPPELVDVALTFPSLTRTAWDVAHVSHALALLPTDPLARFTRAYYLQGVLAGDFSSPLNVVTQAEALAAPIDLADRRNVEARLHAIAVGRAAARAQIALSDGTLQAYDTALADTGAA